MRGKLLALMTGITLVGILMAGPADAALRCVLAEFFTSTT
jgi:hypothetical protein